MQQTDEHSHKLIELLESNGKLTEQEKNEIENYELSPGVLYLNH